MARPVWIPTSSAPRRSGRPLGDSTHMNTPTQPVSTPRWVIVGRCVSSLFCVFVLAVAIPNLGSVSLPNHRIGYGWRDALSVAIMFAPLIVIFIGAICSRVVEYVGWALAFMLLIWMFVAYQRFMAGPSPNERSGVDAGSPLLICIRIRLARHHSPRLLGMIKRMFIYNFSVLAAFCGLWICGYHMSDFWMRVIDVGVPWPWFIALSAASYAVSFLAARPHPDRKLAATVGPLMNGVVFYVFLEFCRIAYDPFY